MAIFTFLVQKGVLMRTVITGAMDSVTQVHAKHTPRGRGAKKFTCVRDGCAG